MDTKVKDGKRTAAVEMLVTFRKAGSKVNRLERRSQEQLEFLTSTGPSDSYVEYKFQLPAGRYNVSVEVTESTTGKIHFAESEYTAPDLTRDFILSDLFIFNLAPEITMRPFPLVGEKVSGQTSTMLFHSEIRANKGDVLTGRAVLFQQIPQAGNEETEKYTSVNQINQVFQLDRGTAAFSGSFDLSNLVAGPYLLEIYLYHNERMVARESRAFKLEWKKLASIYAELDSSIAKMIHVADSSTISDLLGIKDADEKKVAFDKFWEDRETGAEGMTVREYFTRIFEAEDSYTEDVSGYETDRGRTFIRYGTPDSRNEYVKDGETFEAWYYYSWSLKFLFRKTGTRYQLINP